MLLHPREDVGNHDGFEARFASPITAGSAEAQRIGRFSFYVDGQRWEWSENVERLHGYEPGTVDPTTDLVLGHTHPDDWQGFADVLDKVAAGEPLSSRHRIIDAAGRTHWVVVVGDRIARRCGRRHRHLGFLRRHHRDHGIRHLHRAFQSHGSARRNRASQRRDHGRVRHQRRPSLRHPGLALTGDQCQGPKARPALHQRDGRSACLPIRADKSTAPCSTSRNRDAVRPTTRHLSLR